MTIDTNILVPYFGGEQYVIQTLSFWRQHGKSLFLSPVAETELLSFKEATPAELREMENFLEHNFTLVPFDRTLARIAAEIRRNAKIKFPDAAIAATALFTHTPLVTRNQRDFKRVEGLQIVTI